MTKKHFIAFANIVKNLVDVAKDTSDSHKLNEAWAVANAVINVNDNPQFDEARFLKACGLCGL